MMISDRDRIADLLASFALAHDEDRLEDVVGCYITDGVLRVRPPGGADVEVAEHRGHEAIRRNTQRSFSLKPPGRRHLVTNVLVQASREGRRYDVVSYLTIIDPTETGPRVTVTAVYRDDVVVSADRALLMTREVQLDAEPF